MSHRSGGMLAREAILITRVSPGITHKTGYGAADEARGTVKHLQPSSIPRGRALVQPAASKQERLISTFGDRFDRGRSIIMRAHFFVRCMFRRNRKAWLAKNEAGTTAPEEEGKKCQITATGPGRADCGANDSWGSRSPDANANANHHRSVGVGSMRKKNRSTWHQPSRADG